MLLLLLFACTDYPSLCAANDPSVTTEQCWNAGRSAGYDDGHTEAYDVAYDEGYATCEADHGW